MLFYLLKYALSNFRPTKHHSDFVRGAMNVILEV